MPDGNDTTLLSGNFFENKHMAHFIKLNVLDPSHDINSSKREYIPQLINLDMVVTVEPSVVHSLVFVKNNQHPIRVKESLDEILMLSKSCHEKGPLRG
jgi:hypothetical protein